MDSSRTTVSSKWKYGSLRGADAVAEAIASKDLNNLYRTSCYFSEVERYQAFCAFYAVMRILDDRIDGVLARRKATANEKSQELNILRAWQRIISACLDGHAPAPRDILECKHPHACELHEAFTTAVERFPVPAALWDNFFAAMRQDLERCRFAVYSEFVDYAEGATVAPTTIYLYLIAAERRNEDATYHPPRDFDLIRCGRELGLFAYLAHIIRDLTEDLAAGDRGLLYFAADDMAAHGVTERMLLADLASGGASPPLRALVRDLVHRARYMAGRGRAYLRPLKGKLSPDRAFILELIVQIYEAVIEKIISCSYDPMADGCRLKDAEKKRIALKVAAQMGLSLT